MSVGMSVGTSDGISGVLSSEHASKVYSKNAVILSWSSLGQPERVGDLFLALGVLERLDVVGVDVADRLEVDLEALARVVGDVLGRADLGQPVGDLVGLVDLLLR